MRFDVITLFPGVFDGFLSESILANAVASEKVSVHLHNLRNWASDRHQKVDDTPYGGGPGMVLMVDRVVPCVESVQAECNHTGRLVILSPQGRRLDQKLVEELAAENRIIMLCGRYEGFDERVYDILQPDEISIGDYVLNGGEVAAMVLIETVMRLVPGVLGDDTSAKLDSFRLNMETDGTLLEHAQYTRPREYRGHTVPEVLLNGNHQEIAKWREQNSLYRTATKRPDLTQ